MDYRTDFEIKILGLYTRIDTKKKLIKFFVNKITVIDRLGLG